MKWRAFSFLLVLTLGLCRVAGAVEASVLTVHVQDLEGGPVARAIVSLDGLEVGKTDKAGTLDVPAGERAGTNVVVGVVSSKGLAASAVTALVLVPGAQDVEVTLVPEPEPVRVASVALAQEAGPEPTDATLAIWVVDDQGRAISEAEVLMDRRVAGSTDAEGALVLETLRPGRRVALQVRAQHRVSVSLGSLVLEKGRQGRTVALQAADVDEDGVLDLVDACLDQQEVYNLFADEDGCADQLSVLSVLVLDPDGYAVEGASVKVAGEDRGGTSADGRLLITGLMPETRVSLRADAEGSDPGGIGALDLVQGSQSVTVKLQRSKEDWGSEPVLVVEVVNPGGAAVPGAAVRVDGQYKGVTDQGGRLEYGGRRVGSTLVVAVAAPEADRLSTAMLSVTLEGGRQVLRVRLDGGDLGVGALAVDDADGDGVIASFDECPTEAETLNNYRDEDGCPDALAVVRVTLVDPENEPLPGATLRTLRGVVATADGEGVAEVLDLVPETSVTWEVRASEPGYRSAVLRVESLKQGLQEERLTLGWRDADGDGVPDLRDACADAAEVVNGYADDDGCPDKLSSILVTVLLPSGEPATAQQVTLDGRDAGLTDAEGDLRLSDLVPGETVTLGVGVSTTEVRLIEGAQREKLILR